MNGMIMETRVIGARKINRVSKACSHCRNAHACCDKQRPCQRCIERGLEDSCVDAVTKKRGPKTRRNSTRSRRKSEISKNFEHNFKQHPEQFKDESPFRFQPHFLMDNDQYERPNDFAASLPKAEEMQFNDNYRHEMMNQFKEPIITKSTDKNNSTSNQQQHHYNHKTSQIRGNYSTNENHLKNQQQQQKQQQEEGQQQQQPVFSTIGDEDSSHPTLELNLNSKDVKSMLDQELPGQTVNVDLSKDPSHGRNVALQRAVIMRIMELMHQQEQQRKENEHQLKQNRSLSPSLSSSSSSSASSSSQHTIPITEDELTGSNNDGHVTDSTDGRSSSPESIESMTANNNNINNNNNNNGFNWYYGEPLTPEQANQRARAESIPIVRTTQDFRELDVEKANLQQFFRQHVARSSEPMHVVFVPVHTPARVVLIARDMVPDEVSFAMDISTRNNVFYQQNFSFYFRDTAVISDCDHNAEKYLELPRSQIIQRPIFDFMVKDIIELARHKYYAFMNQLRRYLRNVDVVLHWGRGLLETGSGSALEYYHVSYVKVDKNGRMLAHSTLFI